jgi:hypothetical protein
MIKNSVNSIEIPETSSAKSHHSQVVICLSSCLFFPDFVVIFFHRIYHIWHAILHKKITLRYNEVAPLNVRVIVSAIIYNPPQSLMSVKQ